MEETRQCLLPYQNHSNSKTWWWQHHAAVVVFLLNEWETGQDLTCVYSVRFIVHFEYQSACENKSDVLFDYFWDAVLLYGVKFRLGFFRY